MRHSVLMRFSRMRPRTNSSSETPTCRAWRSIQDLIPGIDIADGDGRAYGSISLCCGGSIRQDLHR